MRKQAGKRETRGRGFSEKPTKPKKPRGSDNADNDGWPLRTRAEKWADVHVWLSRLDAPRLSDRAIARACRVSQPFVSKIRRELAARTAPMRPAPEPAPIASVTPAPMTLAQAARAIPDAWTPLGYGSVRWRRCTSEGEDAEDRRDYGRASRGGDDEDDPLSEEAR